MEWKIEIEKYPNGTMGIILPKSLVEKFDQVFGERAIDIFASLTKKDKRMVIEITLPKQTYIA